MTILFFKITWSKIKKNILGLQQMQQLLQSQLAGFNPAQLQQLMQQQQQILSHHQVKRLKDILQFDKYLINLTNKKCD